MWPTAHASIKSSPEKIGKGFIPGIAFRTTCFLVDSFQIDRTPSLASSSIQPRGLYLAHLRWWQRFHFPAPGLPKVQLAQRMPAGTQIARMTALTLAEELLTTSHGLQVLST